MITVDAEHVGPWVFERIGTFWVKGRGNAIGKLKDGELIAGVVYEDWNGPNVVCHIAGEGNWATPKFLATIFDYPFNQLKVRRITVPVCASNVKSIKLVEKLGFRKEAELLGATSKGNLLLFRMFRDECKYIKGTYGKRLLASSSS